MKEQILKLNNLIKESNKILLINHIRMDMDAFGSLSAFYQVLTQLDKNVKAINDEIVSEHHNIAGYKDIINPDLNIEEFNPDLIISFDAASEEQLGNSYKNNIEIFKSSNFVVIDHHKTNPGFGKINIIDPNYSSTCELVFDILNELDYIKFLNKNAATSLLSGIYTDTNVFYNSNTTSNTHYVSGKLIDLGADFRKPYYEFYKKKTFSGAKLWGEVLANHMKISNNGKLVWALIKKDIFKKTDSNERQLTGLISEFFANIEGVEIAFISHEIDNDLVKTSFRSTPEYDVSEIANHFGGGGHKQAAGFSSVKELYEIEKDILDYINNNKII